MIYSISNLLHIISAVIWVGGMFFAYMALRPVAAALLQPQERLTLWLHTFARFFPWVWVSVILLPLTGYGMAFGYWGGMATFPIYVHVMQGLGIVMILMFLHIWFAPYKRLRRSLDADDLPTAANALAQIRKMIGINLMIGLIVVVVAAGGRTMGV